jgi:hypothetical protein
MATVSKQFPSLYNFSLRDASRSFAGPPRGQSLDVVIRNVDPSSTARASLHLGHHTVRVRTRRLRFVLSTFALALLADRIRTGPSHPSQAVASLAPRRRWLPLAAADPLRPTPPPSCRRRARTRTGARRVRRQRHARGNSRRRNPGPPRPGTCTPCVGSSRRPSTPVRFAEDRPSSSRARCMPLERGVNLVIESRWTARSVRFSSQSISSSAKARLCG